MNKAYRCETCGHEVVQDAAKKAPDCCGKPMAPVSLDSCREAGNEAPHVGEKPCQDFTGAQR